MLRMASFSANCGGKVVATYTPQTIMSPGFDTVKHYENKQECNWLITVGKHLL